MRDFLLITRSLADPNRLRILCALGCEEICVCQIVEMLGLAPSTVSKHLSILYQARLVELRKDGRWIYYRLPRGRETAGAARRALAWVRRELKSDPQVEKDAARMAKILAAGTDAICQKQNGRR
ncbi:winged helix-turn-helix transcriptional regulator [bacterium]|nr:winged helix-turn-helix transcriptional regulator [bacterium]